MLWPSFWDSLFTFLPKKYPVETSALVGDYILNDFLKEKWNKKFPGINADDCAHLKEVTRRCYTAYCYKQFY